MADPVALTVPDELLSDVQASRVYLRETWDADWEEVDFLDALSFGWEANPSVSTANLRWDYGAVMQRGANEYAVVEKLDRLNHWIKIEVDRPQEGYTPLKWYGHVEEDARNLEGKEVTMPGGGDPLESGEQPLLAYGLESVLDRQKITRCTWMDESGIERELGHAIAFNREDQVDAQGNRSTAKGSRGTYVFSGNLYSDAAKWSTLDILRYLCAYHGPKNDLGNDAIEIKLHPVAELLVPDWDEPVIEWHGRTLKEVFDELLDRRRGFGYTVSIEEEGGELGDDAILITPFTFFDESIDLPSGDTLQPNILQFTVDFQTSTEPETATLRKAASQHYEQVVAIGDRILCCGSISPDDANLVRGWIQDQEDAYNTAASGSYAAKDPTYIKQQRNADARGADHLKRVFRYFDLDPDWDGKVGDGIATAASMDYLFPYDELDLLPQLYSGFYLPDLRFERHLPLTDYDQAPAGQKFTYRPPFVVLKLHDTSLDDDVYERYASVEMLSVAAEVELTGYDDAGRDFCCSMQVQDDAPGVILNVVGEQQHVIAGADFVPLLDAADVAVSKYDWRDNLIVTFAMRADWHLEARWPETIVEVADVVRELRIDVGEKAQGHWIANGTVIGLDDGQLQHQANAEWIRDDRELLENLARIAYEWYGAPRQALTLTLRGIWGELAVGDLVVGIGPEGETEDVRTVVTSVRIDLSDDASEPHRETIETQWAELDVVQFA